MKDWVGILSDWPCCGDTKQIGHLGLLESVECFALLYKLSHRLSPHSLFCGVMDIIKPLKLWDFYAM